MEIWKAELQFMCNVKDEWETYFYFELQDKDYEKNEKFNEWVHFKNWVSNRIPMKMLVEPNGYSGLRVVQGFDHNLTEEELKTLELKMRENLKEYLDYEKENYIKTYVKKINSI